MDAAAGGPIEQRVKQGEIVLAVDIRAIGETARKNNRKIGWSHGLLGPNYHEWAVGLPAGRGRWSNYGQKDILVAARFLSDYGSSDKPEQIETGRDRRNGGFPRCTPQLWNHKLFSEIDLSRMISSWGEVVKTPETQNQLINTVHGSLQGLRPAEPDHSGGGKSGSRSPSQRMSKRAWPPESLELNRHFLTSLNSEFFFEPRWTKPAAPLIMTVLDFIYDISSPPVRTAVCARQETINAITDPTDGTETVCPGDDFFRFLKKTTALTAAESESAAPVIGRWKKTNDRVWLGEEFWANPMEDWRIIDGGRRVPVDGRAVAIFSC